jgi:DNA-directed RNA polymerase subunit RPC12/RpoP
MDVELRVYECPSCGAPLPPTGMDTHVACTACGKQTKIESGSDAVLREQKSRADAETLFAKLGRPPRWSQRFATYLVSWKIWVFGFPFALGLVVTIADKPRDWLLAGWEAVFHARLLNVASPFVGSVISHGFTVGILIALLVWSLLGERIDARRDLQAMLAAKPPETAGGATRCRKCDAPLEVAAGALGARCAYCGTDNLVVLPAEWISRARRGAVELRLTMRLARERAKAGRRRLWRASAWRAPLVLGLLAWLVWPRSYLSYFAKWSEMRSDDDHLVVYLLARKDSVRQELRAITTCDRHKQLDPPLDTASSKWCNKTECEAVAAFPLRHGEELHLVRETAGDASVRIAIGERWSSGGYALLRDDTGDEIANQQLPEHELVQKIAISGWYQVNLRGMSGVVVQPCVGGTVP